MVAIHKQDNEMRTAVRVRSSALSFTCITGKTQGPDVACRRPCLQHVSSRLYPVISSIPSADIFLCSVSGASSGRERA